MMRTTRWIDVPYKCSCMAQEATVVLPERGAVEDIEDFMGRVMMALSADHVRRSPLCRSAKMEYAKVPMEGDVVGRAKGGRG